MLEASEAVLATGITDLRGVDGHDGKSYGVNKEIAFRRSSSKHF